MITKQQTEEEVDEMEEGKENHNDLILDFTALDDIVGRYSSMSTTSRSRFLSTDYRMKIDYSKKKKKEK